MVRGDTCEVNLPGKLLSLVMVGLTLKHLNQDTWLVVRIGGEYPCLLAGDGGVAFDERSLDSSSGLNT